MIVAVLVPDNPPVMPPVTIGADQLYNVPDGTIPLVPSVGVKLNDTPLQVVAVIAEITAVGLMVTDTVKGLPVQEPDTGVTVYVAVTAVLPVLVKVPVIAFTPVL